MATPAKRALLGTLAVLVTTISATAIYNRAALTKESKLMDRPLGQMVEVDGHNMCVYTEGIGSRTLVFLSGSGTVCPILDFRGLYRLLSDEYRIVVIEKFGYGFSDVVDGERSFGTMLRQDREALEKLGIHGPYVLCPHSMSGLEAVLWAQTHPVEVEAIVGLDMALPRSYDGYDFGRIRRLGRLAELGRRLGVVRLLYGSAALPKGLSSEEQAIYRAIASRIAVNQTIVNEGLAVRDACALIDAGKKPDVPTLLFVSDGSQTHAEDWVGLQHDWAMGLSDAEVVELACGHYVHHFEPERIAAKMKGFLEGR